MVLDKCCCSNDSKMRDFEDFAPPEILRRSPLESNGMNSYKKTSLQPNKSNLTLKESQNSIIKKSE